MSEEAAKLNMATGLKNSISILSKVQSHVTFAVNEECVKNKECGGYGSFLARNKAVFHIEYANAQKTATRVTYKDAAGSTKKYCNPGGSKKFSTIIKPGNSLSASYLYCDGSPADATKIVSGSNSKEKGGVKNSQNYVQENEGDDAEGGAVSRVAAAGDEPWEDEIVEAAGDGTAADQVVNDFEISSSEMIAVNGTFAVRRSVPMLYRRHLW